MKLDEISVTRLQNKMLHKDIVAVVYKAAELVKFNVGFRVTHGFRTKDEQMALWLACHNKDGTRNGKPWKTNLNGYLLGVKAPNGVVGTGVSRHNLGYAVDLCATLNGVVTWEEKFYPVIANYMLEAAAKLAVPITWGGSWKKNPDMPHFELNKNFYK